jgi:hypothetical protein
MPSLFGLVAAQSHAARLNPWNYVSSPTVLLLGMAWRGVPLSMSDSSTLRVQAHAMALVVID